MLGQLVKLFVLCGGGSIGSDDAFGYILVGCLQSRFEGTFLHFLFIEDLLGLVTPCFFVAGSDQPIKGSQLLFLDLFRDFVPIISSNVLSLSVKLGLERIVISSYGRLRLPLLPNIIVALS